MNRFEFMGSITIGQYLPLDSPLHRLDPRARLLCALLLIIGITLARGPLLLLAAIGLILGLLMLGKVPPSYALRGLRPPLPFLLILAVIQMFFNSTPDSGPVFFTIFGAVIGFSDLVAAFMLLARFAALILALSLVSATLSTSEMTQGLGALLGPLARLHLPVYDFVMMVQVTLRFLPLLAQTAERIAKAQAARGADWDAKGGNLIARTRRLVPMIVPLFVVSLRRAEMMALAMDARAYGSAGARSSRLVLHYGWRDWLAVVLILGVCVALVLLPY